MVFRGYRGEHGFLLESAVRCTRPYNLLVVDENGYCERGSVDGAVLGYRQGEQSDVKGTLSFDESRYRLTSFEICSIIEATPINCPLLETVQGEWFLQDFALNPGRATLLTGLEALIVNQRTDDRSLSVAMVSPWLVILGNVPSDNALRRFEMNILGVVFDTSTPPSLYHQLLKDLVSEFGKNIDHSQFSHLDAGHLSLVVQASLQDMARIQARERIAHYQGELLAMENIQMKGHRFGLLARREGIECRIRHMEGQLMTRSLEYERIAMLWEDIEEKVRELLKDDVDAKTVELRVIVRREKERNESLSAVEKQKRVVKMWKAIH
jgi:hypothetical protein